MLAEKTGHKEMKGVIAVIAGPIMGLVYFLTLPFIAIGAVVVLIATKVLREALNIARSVVSFGWRPSEAYLAGKKKKRNKK